MSDSNHIPIHSALHSKTNSSHKKSVGFNMECDQEIKNSSNSLSSFDKNTKNIESALDESYLHVYLQK